MGIVITRMLSAIWTKVDTVYSLAFAITNHSYPFVGNRRHYQYKGSGC